MKKSFVGKIGFLPVSIRNFLGRNLFLGWTRWVVLSNGAINFYVEKLAFWEQLKEFFLVQNFFLSSARWVDQTNPFPTTKLPIRRKFSYLDENELRLIFILFKWFSIFNLCGLNKETNNHLHFMRFNSTNTISTPFSKPITKSFEVYLLWHLIKFRIHESYDEAC